MDATEKYYNSLHEMYLDNFRIVYMFIKDYIDMLGGDTAAAEDLASVVWIKIAENVDKCIKMDYYHFKNYLRTVARNSVYDHYKDEQARICALEDLKALSETDIAEQEIDSELFSKGKEKYLRDSKNALSREEKLMLGMKYNLLMTSKEVAALFGISDSAVRMRYCRILKKLKTEIIRLMKVNGDFDI